jgi:TRAP-type C4-dicarboxylate transport system permease small subunit
MPRPDISAGRVTESKRPLTFIDRLLVPLLRYVAAAFLAALMLLTCADVVGRYFLNRPINGAFELTEMLLAALIFAGLPLVTLRNEHVMVNLFDTITPKWVLRLQHSIASFIGAVCTGFLAWHMWLGAERMREAGETTAQLKIPVGWLAHSMVVMMALTALALVVLAFRQPKGQEPSSL